MPPTTPPTPPPSLRPGQHSGPAPESGTVGLRSSARLAASPWRAWIGRWLAPPLAPAQARGRPGVLASLVRAQPGSLPLLRPPACVHGHRSERGALPFPRPPPEERDWGRVLPLPLPGVWRSGGAYRRPGHGGRPRGSGHAGAAAAEGPGAGARAACHRAGNAEGTRRRSLAGRSPLCGRGGAAGRRRRARRGAGCEGPAAGRPGWALIPAQTKAAGRGARGRRSPRKPLPTQAPPGPGPRASAQHTAFFRGCLVSWAPTGGCLLFAKEDFTVLLFMGAGGGKETGKGQMTYQNFIFIAVVREVWFGEE